MVFGRPGHEPEDDTDVADAAERAYRENHVIRKKLHRPSLKITRRTDQRRARSFTFEVWNPFTGDYQVEESIEAAMLRVNQLAGLICQMWLQRHPKQDVLMDAPDPEGANTDEWAEFRINATTYRSYDTRRHDKPGWRRAISMIQAAETTCVGIGCAPPRSSPL
jgi:hypothetical protein